MRQAFRAEMCNHYRITSRRCKERGGGKGAKDGRGIVGFLVALCSLYPASCKYGYAVESKIHNKKRDKMTHAFNVTCGRNVLSAQALEVSLLGVETALRLGRDAWSMVQ